VREYWLVHPTDRMVTIYRLEEGGFGKPEIQDLSGETPIGILPGVEIVWDDLVGRLEPPEP
jgi:Uma2 family endonuclease